MKLAELKEFTEQDFVYGMLEWIGEDPEWFSFDWKPGMPHSDHLEKLENNRLGQNLPEGIVPSTMLYAQYEGVLVGRVNIRHHLNKNLEERGGHVGYAIAPRFRGKGLGLEMVKQSLQHCKQIGLTSLLITCASANTASIKIIEAIGGELIEECFDDQAAEPIKKFSVKL
ncbi:MAG: GNAT family N-acetyltransferase [Bdellovibrionales bacterium]|nr:GNAT family N-acetyltransferase [Bdellovibrionales bacterium]